MSLIARLKAIDELLRGSRTPTFVRDEPLSNAYIVVLRLIGP
ncbi:MAG: hypothetical protein AABZ53_13610 [Planctomycetota bacterium]